MHHTPTAGHRYQVVTMTMGNCLWTGNPSRYIYIYTGWSS